MGNDPLGHIAKHPVGINMVAMVVRVDQIFDRLIEIRSQHIHQTWQAPFILTVNQDQAVVTFDDANIAAWAENAIDIVPHVLYAVLGGRWLGRLKENYGWEDKR
jgi:hypothetical protein